MLERSMKNARLMNSVITPCLIEYYGLLALDIHAMVYIAHFVIHEYCMILC